MDLAKIKSRAAAVLLLHMAYHPDSELTGSALCRELGFSSRQTLLNARAELASLGFLGRAEPLPDQLFAPDDDNLDAEADRIDAMETSGKVGKLGDPADRKRKLTILFFGKTWKLLLPDKPTLKERQVRDLVLAAEKSQQAGIQPAALLLKIIRTLSDRKVEADKLKPGYILSMVQRIGNDIQSPRPQPQARPQWRPAPGEAATEEEARQARAEHARAEIARIKAMTAGAPRRKIGMLDEEE